MTRCRHMTGVVTFTSLLALYQLLLMDSWKSIVLPPKKTRSWIGSLYTFITDHKQICDAHTVDFFDKKSWDNQLLRDWTADLESISDSDFLNPLSTTKCARSLLQFLQTARQLRLPTAQFEHEGEHKHSVLSFGMSTKKAHEVHCFAKVISDCTSSMEIDQVLDVGSGKGYLSQVLALQFNLHVVGVDSEQMNTDGATRRNSKVCKQHCHQAEAAKPLERQTCTNADGGVHNSIEELHLDLLFAEAGLTDQHRITCASECESQSSLESRSPCGAESDQPVSEHLPCMLETSSSMSYLPITTKVFSDYGELMSTIDKKSNGYFNSSVPFCVVGLHTCGDLAANALRMFCGVDSAQSTCIVGCCYNHLTEYSKDDVACGFPMSRHLNATGAVLGRTARMLACQNVLKHHSVTTGKSFLSVYRRAVLQMIIKTHFPSVASHRLSEMVVGRLRRAPDDDLTYVRLALQRVGLNPLQVNDLQIKSAFDECQPYRVFLKAMLKLRIALAPCIETLLILDRLLYLQEQTHVKRAFLVQLFNPELSPRCYGVYAIKAVK